jgi:2TM domain
MEGQTSGSGLTGTEEDLRELAIRELRRKREFRDHLGWFIFINVVLWMIWAVDGAETDDLWPAWVTGIWGVFVVSHGWRVYRVGFSPVLGCGPLPPGSYDPQIRVKRWGAQPRTENMSIQSAHDPDIANAARAVRVMAPTTPAVARMWGAVPRCLDRDGDGEACELY